MIINHCGSCGLYRSLQQNSATKICVIDQQPHEPDYFCGNHTNQPTVCDMCGKILLDRRGIIIQSNDTYMIFCEDCYNALGRCSTCKQQCSLDKDNTMPHTVMKTIRQGNMVMQAPVLNPDLVAKHCPRCNCYHDNQCSRRNSSSCDRYESVIS